MEYPWNTRGPPMGYPLATIGTSGLPMVPWGPPMGYPLATIGNSWAAHGLPMSYSWTTHWQPLAHELPMDYPWAARGLPTDPWATQGLPLKPHGLPRGLPMGYHLHVMGYPRATHGRPMG